MNMLQQWKYFREDVQRIIGKRKLRILFIWMSRSFVAVFFYRLERSWYLLLGRFYEILRIPFIPILYLIQSYTNIDIHYKANIKGGISILHPAVGVVISGKSVIGSNITLVGGNIIGINKPTNHNDFVIGNNCSLGANATIIGPLKLGNNIKIGASACVTKDCKEDNVVLVGVPAKIKSI